MMNNLDLSTETGLIGMQIPVSLITSPSVSTFLAEEDASMCPLLFPATPSPPPMDFVHPLTPSTGIEENLTDAADDARAETSSSSGSSGIGMDIPVAGTTTLYNNKNVYQNLGNNNETIQENGTKQYASLNIQITKDTPGFVHWNWPLIRKCSFFFFVSAVIAMSGVVVMMIMSLPKACNPKTAWYKGSVFYEIFPASFQDSNEDGIGDLLGLSARIGYLSSLGIGVVRLNSIFPSKHYPDHFQNVTTLLDIDEVLGGKRELKIVVDSLHAKNMSLVLDLPIYPLIRELSEPRFMWNSTSNQTLNMESNEDDVEKDMITKSLKLWIDLGVDGFYIKGLENYFDDPYLTENVELWKRTIGSNRILIVNKRLFDRVDTKTAAELIRWVDLVEVYLDISQGSKKVAEDTKSIIEGILEPGDGPYIQWSLSGVSERRTSGMSANVSLAATLMQLMLPGSPSIFYGDEIALQESHDPLGDHSDTKHLHHLSTMEFNSSRQFTNRNTLPWLPRGAAVSFDHIEFVADMISLRESSPSIYQNVIRKTSKPERNTSVKFSRNDLLILERWYPRRRSFVSITNFSDKKLSLDLSTMFYSGEIVIGKLKGQRVLFSEFEVGPIETIIIRLDK
ncbi:4F2 cell-surface antigen heavy chain [Pseudolycoriella hygida]|uniref:4F2 cell-surface antigen heavy chain n=1 Tax=Pseudolycoriella hygida TaxID=35572 RepID=A0A9Q0NHJ1_9DIPT|nr:4F2 cell-surface antigen heavy chain [Pseudolycoriella hygida]